MKLFFLLKFIGILGILLFVLLGAGWFFYVVFYFPYYIESYCGQLLYYKEIANREFRQNPDTFLTGKDIIAQFKRSKAPIYGNPKRLSVILKDNDILPMFWVKIPYYLRLNFRNTYIVIYTKPDNTKALKEISEDEFIN